MEICSSTTATVSWEKMWQTSQSNAYTTQHGLVEHSRPKLAVIGLNAVAIAHLVIPAGCSTNSRVQVEVARERRGDGFTASPVAHCTILPSIQVLVSSADRDEEPLCLEMTAAARRLHEHQALPPLAQLRGGDIVCLW